jgi:hypothetical protein
MKRKKQNSLIPVEEPVLQIPSITDREESDFTVLLQTDCLITNSERVFLNVLVSTHFKNVRIIGKKNPEDYMEILTLQCPKTFSEEEIKHALYMIYGGVMARTCLRENSLLKRAMVKQNKLRKAQ